MAHKTYITPEGAQKLQDELNYLWKVERPRVTQAVSEAAAMGDRSENAEYIYGKKKLREIDRRIRWIQKRLDKVIIVDRKPEERDTIFFGAYVKIKMGAGRETIYQIVGPDDLDLEKNCITFSSPLGQGLKGKKIGDKAKIQLPKGPTEIEIIDVSYEPFSN